MSADGGNYDAKDELLRDLEEHLRDSLLEDERGEEFVVDAPEVLRDAITMLERAKLKGVRW